MKVIIIQLDTRINNTEKMVLAMMMIMSVFFLFSLSESDPEINDPRTLAIVNAIVMRPI